MKEDIYEKKNVEGMRKEGGGRRRGRRRELAGMREQGGQTVRASQ
jgi:hypothetical protein